MTLPLIVLGWLAAAGFVPALAVTRRSPVLVFLAPLIGAGIAAVAALIELGAGGSLITCFLVVAVIVNLAVIAWWLAAGRKLPWPGPSWGWSVVAVIAILGALIYPLTALRGQLIGWDANSIWLTHALMISGGHHQLLTSLRNPAYRFSNPDYPPLVPAAGALAFFFFGRGDLHLAVDMTVLLNACALGAVGAGIAAAGTGRALTRITASAAAGALCLVGFAVSGPPGIDGFADLLWAAAAVAAIIWGLVLPRSTQALVIAWICAAVASLTKNEGLTTAVLVIVLIAFRYRPVTLRGPGRLDLRPEDQSGRRAAAGLARQWAERSALVVLPALPGLAWFALIHLLGIRDFFFQSASHESLISRAGATIAGMAGHLAVLPVALAVLAAGSLVLRTDRDRARLGNPAWLWTAWLGSLAVIFGTYVAGQFSIATWLLTSVSRTTVFAQLLLYAELALWLVVAVDAAFGRDERGAVTQPGPAVVRESA